MTTEHCKNCYYWDKEHTHVENNKTFAACLFDAPKVFMFEPGRVYTARPSTPDGARCGKFRENPVNEHVG